MVVSYVLGLILFLSFVGVSQLCCFMVPSAVCKQQDCSARTSTRHSPSNASQAYGLHTPERRNPGLRPALPEQRIAGLWPAYPERRMTLTATCASTLAPAPPPPAPAINSVGPHTAVLRYKFLFYISEQSQ